MVRVAVRPELLRWARARAGIPSGALGRRFPNLCRWERGEAEPTLKQVEAYAKFTHTPVGYLFLQQPPDEKVPIPDFRTPLAQHHAGPSPDLLETIYACQQRQEWYRDYAESVGQAPLVFVGSVRVGSNIERAAESIRTIIGLDLRARARMSTWTDALRFFLEQADAAGIMVMCSGVVGNNNRRRLDPDEFRGFAMADQLAPLVFINGADTKAAQMFTLAHELAHIWLGQSGVSNAQAAAVPDQAVERWCNQVAAELLVPLDAVRSQYQPGSELRGEVARLARLFKVSTLVVLRRIHDAGGLGQEAFRQEYDAEMSRLRALPRGTGGSFYLTQTARVSRRQG